LPDSNRNEDVDGEADEEDGDEWDVRPRLKQGCQMFLFKEKNLNLGNFWRALDWKMLIYFKTIWYILCSFGTFLRF
jgi:hypothetical protein